MGKKKRVMKPGKFSYDCMQDEEAQTATKQITEDLGPNFTHIGRTGIICVDLKTLMAVMAMGGEYVERQLTRDTESGRWFQDNGWFDGVRVDNEVIHVGRYAEELLEQKYREIIDGIILAD